VIVVPAAPAPSPPARVAKPAPKEEAPVVEVIPDDEGAPGEPLPRKKKKRRKKKRPVSESGQARVPAWVWWWSSLATTVLLIAGGLIVAALAGYPIIAALYALSLMFALPISTVVFTLSMFVSNWLGTGVELTEFSTLIPKSLLLILLANCVSFMPCVGGLVALAVWFIGAVVILGLEPWEARVLVLINWVLGWAMWLLVIGALTQAVMPKDKHPEEPPPDAQDASLLGSVPSCPT